MGMGKYGYSENSLALIPPARGREHSHDGPPERWTGFLRVRTLPQQLNGRKEVKCARLHYSCVSA